MSEEMKGCPFCGGCDCFDWSGDGYPDMPACLRKDTHNEKEVIKAWQTRPIEDALQAELDYMTAYADKLVEHLPGGYLPKDIENIREANLHMAMQVNELEAEVETLKQRLNIACHIDGNADEFDWTALDKLHELATLRENLRWALVEIRRGAAGNLLAGIAHVMAILRKHHLIPEE